MERTKTQTMPRQDSPLDRLVARRRFVQAAAAGTVVSLLGSLWVVLDEPIAEARADGRPRVPPGQRVISHLKPMGGDAGSPNPGDFSLKVHGLVEKPFSVSFKELLALPQTERKVDVHCVTGWTALDVAMKGVKVKDLAARAKPKKHARHVIFEAAHGYTSNVRIQEALADSVMIVHHLAGRPLPRSHGAPARVVVPDLYFWKSAKWITGIRFVSRDEPGYWETRGYNNHADPWKEERYS